KGRPGAEGPGAGEFGIAGGLTCVLAEDLTREAIFAALRQRRCYGTTGARMHLDFTVDDRPMGEVIRAAGDEVRVTARVRGVGPVERLQLHRGREVVHEVAAPTFDDVANSRRVRVTWGGSPMPGCGRRATWDGTIRCAGNRILVAVPFCFDARTDVIVAQSDDAVTFRSSTTGDLDGVDLLLD